jgi:acetate kinase
MRILVMNCGSSSLKFQLIETSFEQIVANKDRMLAQGIFERIGSTDARSRLLVAGQEPQETVREVLRHQEAIQATFAWLSGESGLLGSLDEIDGVGHRIVHGGERFHASTLMTEDTVRQIEALSDLAPLHNPHNLKAYYAAKKILPRVPQVAVFDTAFHQTMPAHAYIYGVPYIYYTRDKLRRYGFHGTSHRFVSYRFAQIHGDTREAYKLITCHLGNGCSICAIDRGKVVDTSMGFTPLEGLIMGSRPGDLDAGAVLYMLERAEMGHAEVDVTLNTQSGLVGISGVSRDMRDVLAAAAKGNERAELAVSAFCYRVAKYIGSYYVAMGGADAVLFAGGIGENSAEVRARICRPLSALGLQLDEAANVATVGREGSIARPSSRLKGWVVPTNEELLIARDTLRCMASH